VVVGGIFEQTWKFGVAGLRPRFLCRIQLSAFSVYILLRSWVGEIQAPRVEMERAGRKVTVAVWIYKTIYKMFWTQQA
jgi:hypothetical protein